MKRIVSFAVMLVAIALQQAFASTLQPSTTLPSVGKPEHLYTVANANGYYMNAQTAPTQTSDNFALFAFYEVDGKSDAYYIYNYTANKWLGFTTAYTYSDCTGFVQLKDDKQSDAYFRAGDVSEGYYEFQPYTKLGTVNRYLNWYCGIGNQNPLDGTVSVGLWQDAGNKDSGSKWQLTEVVQHSYTYTISINGGGTITIDGNTYADGDTYACEGSLHRSDIVVEQSEGKLAFVSIDDAAQTVTVNYTTVPAQPSTEAYTRAWVYPMQQENVGTATLTATDGAYTLSNKVLAASFVKVGGALYFAGSKAMNLEAGTEPFTVAFGAGVNVPASAMTLGNVETVDLEANPTAVGGAEHYNGKALVAHYTYTYEGSNIAIVWKAILRDGSHYLRTEMELTGVDDVDMYNVIPLTYNVNTAAAGSTPAVVGNTRGAILLSDKIFAGLENPVGYNTVETGNAADIVTLQGRWSRNTTLAKGETWKISAVVGLVAQDGKQTANNILQSQKRRSFLAYSERERAVPWRANPVYISWYELNIDRNNAADPTKNMNADQVLDVVKQWKTRLYDRYGVAPNSFVIDDGWDNYGTWTFHAGFPHEMRDIAALAAEMNAGVGAWLGPVGGYGTSGDYRRNYWKGKGEMVLSNPAYYQTFLDAATNLTQNNGDFRFFKFDGISAQGTAVGPDPGDAGNENAEGIIRLERYIRENLKRDIFFNTTVGTWASPFWYHYTDATWRQDADYKEATGSNTIDRERWITYRDQLVYENYITASPICPINTLMTHGFILSTHGAVSKNMDYEGCLRELRCAFACGSGMVELYTDYDLLNTINGGQLWADLAECIKWQKRNADVLADAHWVGGNPWNGSKTSVYGWAAWNGTKSTLTLRNGANSAANYTFTLREALNIPANVSGSIVLRKSFGVQDALQGLNEGEAIDIDQTLNVTLPSCSVFCFDGIDATAQTVSVAEITLAPENEEKTVAVGNDYVVNATVAPANATFQALAWSVDNAEVATVCNGRVKALAKGNVTVTAAATDGSGVKASIVLTVGEGSAPEVEEYPVNFDKNATHTRSDRQTTAISLQQEGKEKQTISTTPLKLYEDLSAESFTVDAGSELTATFDFSGEWMHGYVYIDLNNDKQFSWNADGTDQSGTELVAYSYYKDLNSDGETVAAGNKNINPPSFTAPTTPGTYRIRYKIDWDNVDPGGCVDTGNHIRSNGGGVWDATLVVNSLTDAINSVSADATNAEYYDLSGRHLTTAPSHGVFIKKHGKSAEKIVK